MIVIRPERLTKAFLLVSAWFIRHERRAVNSAYKILIKVKKFFRPFPFVRALTARSIFFQVLKICGMKFTARIITAAGLSFFTGGNIFPMYSWAVSKANFISTGDVL